MFEEITEQDIIRGIKDSLNEERALKCLIMHFEDLVGGRVFHHVPFLNDFHLDMMEEMVLEIDSLIKKNLDKNESETVYTSIHKFLAILTPLSLDKLKNNLGFWMTYVELINDQLKTYELKSKHNQTNPQITYNYGSEPVNLDEHLYFLIRTPEEEEIEEFEKSIDYKKIRKEVDEF